MDAEGIESELLGTEVKTQDPKGCDEMRSNIIICYHGQLKRNFPAKL